MAMAVAQRMCTYFKVHLKVQLKVMHILIPYTAMAEEGTCCTSEQALKYSTYPMAVALKYVHIIIPPWL